jgi:single-strand DNA-binding protein
MWICPHSALALYPLPLQRRLLEARESSRYRGPSKGNAMANHISLRGFVSSEFEMRTTADGIVIGKFRMGSTDRRLDPITNTWTDGRTNWYHITVFRALASNAVASIRKGDRILVVGKLHINSFLRKDGTPGTSVEIDAESIGPDLQFGTAHYTRMVSARPAGQGNSRDDAGHPSVGELLSARDEGEFPEDQPADSRAPFESGGQQDDGNGTGDDDDQAAALDSDETDEADGLEEGEHADMETGEISKEPVPF